MPPHAPATTGPASAAWLASRWPDSAPGLAGGPLPAITDRVVAQQGDYWSEPLNPGGRHKIRFEEDPATLL